MDNILRDAIPNTSRTFTDLENIFEKYFRENHVAQEKKSIIVIEDIPVTKNEFDPPINKLLHMVERKIKISPYSVYVLLTFSDDQSEKLIEQIYGQNCFHKISPIDDNINIHQS